MARRIDSHQHFWDLRSAAWNWSGNPVLDRVFEPVDLEPELRQAGIEGTVVVQALDAYEDTDYMLRLADETDWILAVVGWVPLLRPSEAEEALERLCAHPKFRGVRHLIHGEADPDWIVREAALESLGLLARRGLVYQIAASYPRHLEHVPRLAEAHPSLKLVIDHLASPPLPSGELSDWRRQLEVAAAYPNVTTKVSELGWATKKEEWSVTDIEPAVEAALEIFGADRLMWGSDWPVCLVNGSYQQVWDESLAALRGCSERELDAILGGTAERVYLPAS